MTTMTEQAVAVTGGVETHQDQHVAAALDQLGRVLGTQSFPTTVGGYRDLLRWLSSFGTLGPVGVEGTGSYGVALARHLAGQGVSVIEVARPNRQVWRRYGKTDVIDAIAAARAVQSGEATGKPKSHDGPVEALRVLKAVHRSANKARTQALNQIHQILVTAPEPLRAQLEGRKRPRPSSWKSLEWIATEPACLVPPQYACHTARTQRATPGKPGAPSETLGHVPGICPSHRPAHSAMALRVDEDEHHRDSRTGHGYPGLRRWTDETPERGPDQVGHRSRRSSVSSLVDRARARGGQSAYNHGSARQGHGRGDRKRRTVRRWWSTPGRCAQQVARPRGDVRDQVPNSGPVDVDRLGRRSGVDGEAAAAGGHGDRSTLTGRRTRHGAVRRVDAGPSGVQFHATITSVVFHPDVAAAGEVLSAADGAVFSTLAW